MTLTFTRQPAGRYDNDHQISATLTGVQARRSYLLFGYWARENAIAYLVSVNSFAGMDHYTYVHALVGGCLIGFASLIATALSGKVPGISGVFGRLLVPTTPDKSWRLLFLIGLIGGAALSFALCDSAAVFRPMRSLGVMAVAGLLVGFGTRLGGGCTSGHGVCGVGTGQKDSMAATLIFIAVAILTVFVVNGVNL